VVQINGKVRARVAARTGATEDEVKKLAFEDPKAAPWLEGKTVRKAVYVPGKLLNIVAT
jgi:leucyl-tRNA synthetase